MIKWRVLVTGDHSNCPRRGRVLWIGGTVGRWRHHRLLVLNYLGVESQKTGQKALGRTVTVNSSFPMDNFVATQENGTINGVDFVLGQQKFLRLDRTSTAVISDADMLALAAKLGTKMKGFR